MGVRDRGKERWKARNEVSRLYSGRKRCPETQNAPGKNYKEIEKHKHESRG